MSSGKSISKYIIHIITREFIQGLLTNLFPGIQKIHPAAFATSIGCTDSDFRITGTYLRNENAGFDSRIIYAPINLPNGVTVTQLIFLGENNDGAASITLDLLRVDEDGGATTTMAETAGVPGIGAFENQDSSIEGAVIDNVAYSYCLELTMNNNDGIGDTQYNSAQINYTWPVA